MDEKYEPLSDELLLLKELHLFFSNSDFKHQTRKELGKDSPITAPFIPLSTAHWHEALQKLVKEDLIERKGMFLDIGSGDGRCIAFTASHGIPSVGVEINKKLVELSEAKLKELHKRKVFDKRPSVLHGDAFSEEAYRKHGGFRAFSTIFTNKTLEEHVVAKVMKDSKTGTRVVLYDAEEAFYPQLKTVARFSVSGQGKHISDYLSRAPLTVKVLEK